MIRNVMNVLFPLITFKYASLVIMPEGVGATNYSSAIIGYFGLIAQLGITAYAIAEGAKIRADKALFTQFANKVFTINFISTLISYVLLMFVMIYSTNLKEYSSLIIIYSVTLMCTTLGVEWIFIVYEDFIYITIRSIVFQLISLVLLFLIVKSNEDVLEYAVISVLATSGSYVLNFFYSKKYLKLKLVNIFSVKEHVKPILIIWIANVASLIYVNADTIVIGYLLGDREVGIYAAATKIIKAICIPITTIGTVSGPLIAENISKKNKRAINDLTQNVIEKLSFMVFPCMIGLFLLARQSILLVSGNQYLSGIVAERILILDILIAPLNSFFTNQLLVPAHKEQKTMVAMILAAIGNIILDVILIPILGINGAAIATVFSELIVFIMCLPEVKKLITFNYVFKGSLKYLVFCLPIVFIVKGFERIDAPWWTYTFLVILLSVIAYFGLILLYQKVKSDINKVS